MNGHTLDLWWAARSQREQWLLGTMLALLAMILLWLLIARPLMSKLEEAKLRHGEAVIAVAEARGQSARARRVAASPAAAIAIPVDALIRRTAIEAGFTGARVAGRGADRASVVIGAARPPAFFAWVAALERQGLSVESLRASANPDRTLATETLFAVRNR